MYKKEEQQKRKSRIERVGKGEKRRLCYFGVCLSSVCCCNPKDGVGGNINNDNNNNNKDKKRERDEKREKRTKKVRRFSVI